MLLLVMPIAAAVFTGAQVERLQAVVGVLLVGLGAGLRSKRVTRTAMQRLQRATGGLFVFTGIGLAASRT